MESTRLSNTEQIRFDGLMRDSHKKVYNLAYRLSMNRQDAEDLTQEAFLRAYRSFHTYQGDKPFENWILRIVTRLFLDLKRARSRRVQALSYDAPRRFDGTDDMMVMESADPNPTADQQLLEKVFDENLESALSELKPEHRELIMMADVEELPYSEIAAAAGVPIGTVRSRLHRAHKRLRELLVLNNEKRCKDQVAPCSAMCQCALSA